MQEEELLIEGGGGITLTFSEYVDVIVREHARVLSILKVAGEEPEQQIEVDFWKFVDAILISEDFNTIQRTLGLKNTWVSLYLKHYMAFPNVAIISFTTH